MYIFWDLFTYQIWCMFGNLMQFLSTVFYSQTVKHKKSCNATCEPVARQPNVEHCITVSNQSEGPPHLPLAASKSKTFVISLTKAPTRPTGSECISWRAHDILSVKAKLFGFEGPKSDLLMMNINESIQMSGRNSRCGNGLWLDLWIII